MIFLCLYNVGCKQVLLGYKNIAHSSDSSLSKETLTSWHQWVIFIRPDFGLVSYQVKIIKELKDVLQVYLISFWIQVYHISSYDIWYNELYNELYLHSMLCCLLQKYSNWDETQDCFVFPDKETLMKYKVIVTTMITAGRSVTFFDFFKSVFSFT